MNGADPTRPEPCVGCGAPVMRHADYPRMRPLRCAACWLAMSTSAMLKEAARAERAALETLADEGHLILKPGMLLNARLRLIKKDGVEVDLGTVVREDFRTDGGS